MSSASQVKLSYVKEATFGTTPATPTMKTVPFNTGDAFTNPRDTLQSAQVQSTRQPRNLRMGRNQPGKTLTAELQWQSFDDLLADGWGDTWEGGETITESITTTATEIVLASGTWAALHPNLAAGNYIVFLDDAAWRVLYVSSVSGDTITVLAADASSAPGLTVDAEASSHTFYSGCVGARITCSAENTMVFAATGSTVTLAAGHANGWDDLGFKAGDNIFFDGTSSNDGWHKISDISSNGLVLTLAAAPTDETINTAVDVDVATDAGLINNGNTLGSYTFEETFDDHATYKYRQSKGVKVGSIQISVQPNVMIQLTLELVGGTITDFVETSVASAETAFTERDAFDSFTGSIEQAGSAVSITGLNFTLNNQLNRNFNLFSRNASEITAGTPQMTGDVNLYFDDYEQATKYFNETETSFFLRMIDPDGNAYVLDLQTVKYTGDTVSIGDIDVTEALPFQLVPATSGYEAQLRRQPVAH